MAYSVVITLKNIIKMEDNNKLVKVYSNNSKKSRLKRNKNKFQRVWDAEKQAYVKVRKAKYPIISAKSRKDWREVDNSSAIHRRQTTPKVKKSVPVKAIKPVAKPETKHKTTVVHNSKPTAIIHRINGINYTWDAKTLHYKKAA